MQIFTKMRIFMFFCAQMRIFVSFFAERALFKKRPYNVQNGPADKAENTRETSINQQKRHENALTRFIDEG